MLKEKVLFKRKLFKNNYNLLVRLPKELTDKLRWREGNDVAVFPNGDGLMLEKVRK